MITYLFNERMINAKQTSTYHHNPVKIYKGYICISPTTVPKNIGIDKLQLSVGALKRKDYKVIPENKVPENVKAYFGFSDEIPENVLICAYPPCDIEIDKGKYCSRKCANRHKMWRKKHG